MEKLRLHFTKESHESHNPHVVVQLFSHVWLFVTPWTAACQASLSFTISLNLLNLKSIELVMPTLHLILCHPLLLPSVFPSIRVFSNESVLCIRWPKDWSFSISPSSEYSGLISFRTDWFDFLAVQCTVKSLLQHHSLKASILRCSAFLMVQLSHPHMTTGKPIALTIGTFISNVMFPFHMSMQRAESVRSSEDLRHQSLVSLHGPAIKHSLLQNFGFFGLTVCQAHQGDFWKQGITRTVLLALSTQGLRINLGVLGAMPSVWPQSL